MRWRSSATEPFTRGAGPPYPRFLPREKVQRGMAYLLAVWRMDCSWVVFWGLHVRQKPRKSLAIMKGKKRGKSRDGKEEIKTNSPNSS